MREVKDYLAWRGDIELSYDPFNEIDAALLSWISYVEYGELFSGEAVPLRTIAERFQALHNVEEEEKRNLFFSSAFSYLVDIGASRRLGEVELVDYESIKEADQEVQFAALTLTLPDGSDVVVYRGTDSSFIGWKEDFNLSYLEEVPAQRYAVRYLERIAQRGNPIYIAGHSKGGNLSVFAGVKAAPETRQRIRRIYNYDGPGMTKTFLESTEYKEMVGRIENIVPETSIVGMMFGHQDRIDVVKSSVHGLGQHNLTTWEVDYHSFVRQEKVDEASVIMDETLSEWISSIELADREIFLNAIYEIFTATNMHSLEELADGGSFKVANAMLTAMKGMTSEQKAVIKEALKKLFQTQQRVISQKLKDHFLGARISTAEERGLIEHNGKNVVVQNITEE